MSLKSAPFWWVICDDCGASAQESSDVSAWMRQDVAVDEALAQDWWIADRHDDDRGKDYCDDCVSKHDIWYCEGCAELKRIVRDDGARWCSECAVSLAREEAKQ